MFYVTAFRLLNKNDCALSKDVTLAERILKDYTRKHGLRAGCQGTSAISAGTNSAGDFTHSLAPALFAGCDHESCGGLGEVVHFDATAMRAAVSWHTSNRGPILLQLDIFETPSPSFSP